MIRASWVTLAIGLSLVPPTNAPAPQAAVPAARPQKPPAPAPTAMTNRDVINLAKAGFKDDLILAAITGAPATSFDVSVKGLLALKQAGISDAVIGVIMKRMAPEPTAPVEPQISSRPETATPSGTTRPRRAADDRSIPPEIGVYARVAGKLVDLRPEIVNWRSGGFLKRALTGGLAGGHVNASVTNPRSPNVLDLPLEVVIYTPDGTSVAEYQLLRLDEQRTRREFRIMSAGIAGARSGADRNLVEFASERVATRTYVIRIENLPAGEYGFLPPGLSASSAASSGKIYSFSIR